MLVLRLSFLLTLSFVNLTIRAQDWQPGTVYREYSWTTPAGHHEAFLRVGGRYGYQAQPDKLPDTYQDGNDLLLPPIIDLEGVIRAEITVEKVMSHENSRNLSVAVNGHAPIPFQEPATIPEPQTEYMYHTSLTVQVPLEQLRGHGPVRLQLSVDSTQRWNWPQNLVYGIALRTYYAPAAAPEKVVVAPDQISEVTYLTANAKNAKRIDYVLVGKQEYWSGQGETERTHWQTFRGEPHRIIGSSATENNNFAVRWNTEWLPDQDTFGVQARVLGTDGKWRVSAIHNGLRLAKRPYRVDIAEIGPAPRNWVTRSGTFRQELTLPDNIDNVTAYRLYWTSWSPCYANGLYLNDHLVWDSETDCYVFATHDPTFTGHAIPYLQAGKNVISTGLTPLMRGKMVHGMEVQWPGVQLAIKRPAR